MQITSLSADARHSNAVRRILLLTTALGSTLGAAAPVMAENIAYSGTGPYVLTQTDPVSGGPRTIDVAVSSGDIAIDTATVNVENNATNPAPSGTPLGVGISANNTGSGNTTVKSGTVTATGNGQTAGIDARVTSGVLSITSGTITSTATNSTAINAISSAGGNVTVNADQTIGARRGIFTSGAGATVINSKFATASGLVSPNAIIGQGATVEVDSQLATLTGDGNQGAAIFVQSAVGNATIRSGTASTQGYGQVGIALQYANADGLVTSELVSTSGDYARGIYGSAVGVTAIRSTMINTSGEAATGIFVSPNSNISNDIPTTGSVDVVSGTITTTGAEADAILVTPTTPTRGRNGTMISGAIAVDSDSITTSGAFSRGIAVNGTSGSIDITSRAITTHGEYSTGIDITRVVAETGNPTQISNTGPIVTTGNYATAIKVYPGTGAVTIANSGSITTGGIGAYGITANMTSGSMTLAGAGPVTTTGDFSHGIYLAPGAGTYSGATSLTSGPIATSGRGASGIFILNTAGPVTINASDIRATGADASAIVVVPVSGATAPIDVQAGIVRTTGSGAHAAINLSSNGLTGPITVNVADTISTGAAVDARSVGAVSVTSGIARVTGGASTGLVAISSGDTATLVSTDLAVTNNRGIFVQGRDNASVTSGILSVTGNNQAIFAQTSSGSGAGTAPGTVAVKSTTLTSEAGGINAFGPRATINVDSGSVVAGNAVAIAAYGVGVTVRSERITTGHVGIDAGFANGSSSTAPTVIDSGSITLNGAAVATGGAIQANGAGVIVNSGTILATGLGNRFGINAQVFSSDEAGITQPGTIAITSGSITTVGNGAYGIQASSDAGAITIDSTGAISTSGTTRLAGTQPRYSAGIVATSQSGAITIASNDITTSGAQSDGVHVEAGNAISSSFRGPNVAAAAISVTTSGTTQTSGGRAAGVRVRAGDGVVAIVNSGTIGTTGEDSQGIDVQSGGDLSIDSVTATATQGFGIFASVDGLVDIRSGTASAGGIANSAIYAVGGTGVTLVSGSASSTAATITDEEFTQYGHAIYLEAVTGAVTATIGNASATGEGADAVHILANGSGGAATVSITGAVSSASGIGLFIDPPGAVNISVASGASITGALSGIDTIGGSNTIVNEGTISSTGGAAIVAAGATALTNSGAIVGTGDVAVRLGATDDSVTLRTGSRVTGVIAGGGGTDAAFLSGTTTTASPTQSIAAFAGFDSLTVQNGYWTADANGGSAFNTVTVDTDSALELANGATGIVGIFAPAIVANGTVVVRSDAVASGGTLGNMTIGGSGSVLLTGPGTVTLDGTDAITTSNGITVDSGRLLLTGTQGGAVTTNAGGTFQLGNGGTTGTFTGSLVNNGTLNVNHSDDYTFGGALTGTGSIVKDGAGKLTFGTGYAFTGTTTVNGGSIRLTTAVVPTTEVTVEGNGQIDLSGLPQTVAELAGTSTTASVNIDNGSLAVNQSTNTSFSGALVGNGTLTKTGSGSLNLTGTNTYTGGTAVNEGRLAVNGSIVSPLVVNSGGTLGGTGTTGNVTIGAGGIYAPGNSIGTQTVAGNVVFATGSIFGVETNAAGAADRVNASGTVTINGGTVAVTAAPGNYANLTDYTVLTGADGVTGRFTGVTSNLAFLSPSLNYSTNAVTLTLARNDISFAALGKTGNQVAVANAVQALGIGNAIYTVALLQTTGSAGTTFDRLSGEIHASTSAFLIDGGRRTVDAVLSRGRENGGEGFGLWAQGIQSYTDSERRTGLAKLSGNQTGMIGGLDYAGGNWRVGLNGGYADNRIQASARGSRAHAKTKSVGGSLAWQDDRIVVQAGIGYAWHDLSSMRTPGVTGIAASLASKSDATSLQLFGEASYRVVDGNITVAPYLRNEFTSLRSKAFVETGGTGALSVGRDTRDADFTSLGLRIGGTAPVSETVSLLPHMSVAYRRGWGKLGGDTRTAAFVGAAGTFTVAGTPLGRNSADLEGGADLAFGQRITVGVNGFGSISKEIGSYGVRAAVSVRF